MLTIYQLMKYLRKHHSVAVKSNQAQALRNIGYYHGYKGYRFIRQPRQRISFTIDLSQTIVCTPEEAIPIISSTKNV